MLTEAIRKPAAIDLPHMVKQAVSSMEMQGRDSKGFINLLKTSGPHIAYMFSIEKSRLLNRVCEMPRGNERDDLIAQAALLKNIINTLEAIK